MAAITIKLVAVRMARGNPACNGGGKTQFQATFARLFPKSDQVTHRAIIQSLITLRPLDDDGFDNLLNLVVKAAQDK